MPRRWLAIVGTGLLAAGLFAASFGAFAAPATYAINPVHTRVMFAVWHEGFSKAIGTVSGSTGTLSFDPEDWTSAHLEAQVPLERLDLGDDKWKKAVLAKSLLDVAEHPVVTFTSTRIEPIDANHASVYGTLTVRGVAKEVKLDVTLNALKRQPLPPFRRAVGFSATTTISRKAFGLTVWPTVIGDEVELRIEAEATRTRGNGEEADTTDTGTPQPPQTGDEPAIDAEPAVSEPAETPPTQTPAEPEPEPMPEPAPPPEPEPTP